MNFELPFIKIFLRTSFQDFFVLRLRLRLRRRHCFGRYIFTEFHTYGVKDTTQLFPGHFRSQ